MGPGLLAEAPGSLSRSPATARRTLPMAMNIIYIHCHDAGRFLSPYRPSIPSPNLKAFASESTVFTQAFCNAPTCSPSRAALLTGFTAHQAGMMGLAHRGFQLRDDEHHICTFLSRHGFETVLSGIQHEWAYDGPSPPYEKVVPQIGRENRMDVENDLNIARATSAFLRSRRDTRPLFLSVGFYYPHRSFPRAERVVGTDRVKLPACLPDNEVVRADMAAYQTAVSWMDKAFGEVWKAIQERGFAENSVIIFTTDHGIAFPRMKATLSDHGLGVAFMLKAPGQRIGHCDAMVSHLDFFPTVCDYIGVETPSRCIGRSLRPLVEKHSNASGAEEVFAEINYHAEYEPKRCIRTREYKYIRNYMPGHNLALANIDEGPTKTWMLEHHFLEGLVPEEELYDLMNDPAETNNLAASCEYSGALRDMRSRLAQWMVRTDDPLYDARPSISERKNITTQCSSVSLKTDSTVRTVHVQRLIDSAHSRGGGTVVLTPGDYICGTLELRSGVCLHLEHGARILGSKNLADYPLRTQPTIRCRADANGFRSLIYAENADNVGITGSGTIDGNGEVFACAGDDMDGRPRLIQMIGCRGVRIENLHLRNAGMWLQHYLGCERVRVSGVDAWNHGQPNNDFLDIEGCQDVRVSDCTSDTDDDGITLKSGCARPCEDVVISNCTVRSHCNAIKLGTESNAGFRNITINNCTIAASKSPRNIHGFAEGICGIALESVDGGDLERVIVSGIAMQGVRVPIFVRLGNRARPFVQGGKTQGVGSLRNVILENIVGTGHGDIGCILTGLPGHPLDHLTLSNVRLELAGGCSSPMLPEALPEKESDYPEATMFGTAPAWGIFIRHARNVFLHNVRLSKVRPDARPDIVLLDVE